MRERTLLGTLMAMQFTHLVDFVILMPLGPQLMRDLDCTPQQFTALVAAYTLASGVAAAVAGTVLDRFDRRSATLLTYAGMTAATAGCGLVDSFAALLIMRLAAGACGGLVGALAFTIVGERIPWERRAAASGLLMAAFSLASVIGIPIGVWLAQLGHWQTPFLALAGLGAAVLLIAGRLLAPMRDHVGPGRPLLATVAAVFGEGSHLRAFVLTICLTFSGFTVIPLLASYLVLNVGLTEADVAWFYGLGGVCTMVTGPGIGRLADRFGKLRIFLILATLSIIPLLACTHLPPLPFAAAIACGVGFIILVSGRFVPAMALITQAARPDLRGAFQAYHTSVQSLASGLATLVAGALVTRGIDDRLVGYGRVGWIAAGVSVLALVAARRLGAVPQPAASSPAVPSSP